MVAKPIRTLVVDDSVFMRTILKGALEKAPNIEVIGTAQNGNEALEKVAKLKPDVMTLDIEMPGLDGIGVLEKVMADSPMPIVMISTKTQEGAKLTFDALELGAVDYVPKPLADKSASLQGFREAVVRAVEAAFQVNRKRLRPDGQKPLQRPNSTELDIEGRVIAIGISAGGPATLHKLIPVIPPGFPPIVVTQHMPADFTGPFAKRLDAASEITVCEAKTGETLEPGKLILAAGDRHLRVIKRGGGLCASLDDGPKVAGFRPSVDVLFESVAKTVGDGRDRAGHDRYGLRRGGRNPRAQGRRRQDAFPGRGIECGLRHAQGRVQHRLRGSGDFSGSNSADLGGLPAATRCGRCVHGLNLCAAPMGDLLGRSIALRLEAC